PPWIRRERGDVARRSPRRAWRSERGRPPLSSRRNLAGDVLGDGGRRILLDRPERCSTDGGARGRARLERAVSPAAWRGGAPVAERARLQARGRGLAAAELADPIPAARWSAVAAAMALRLLRAVAPDAVVQRHELEMTVNAIAAMAGAGAHDESRRIHALA